ncbi:MAG TPA: zf-HC2 domain-containing protein [Cellvibrionaceae bacterium]
MKIVINCRKATQLMSESRERTLSRRERWALALHKAMCSGCRNFDRQIEALSDLTEGFKYVSHGADEKSNGNREG